jgi:hypothetical protein
MPVTPDVLFPTIPRSKPCTVISSYFGPTILSSTSAETDGVITPHLSDFADYASWSAVYDTYRILTVKIEFVPTETLAPTGGVQPIYTAIDYDDGNSVTLANLIQYDTVMVSPMSVYHQRVFNPRTAMAIYGGATFTSYGQSKYAQWLDLNSAGVPHFGLKYGVAASTNVNGINTKITAVLQFKNAR